MLTLRPYQTAIIDSTHADLRNTQRVLSVAPTGAGKRYIGVWWCQGIVARGKRVLVVTDRRLLVGQFYDELENAGIDYGIIMAGYAPDRSKPVQVACIHTLKSRYMDDGDGLPPADWVIVDEAHKSPALYEKLFSYYPDAKIVGLTATPVGPQGRSLIGLYDTMVEGVANSQLIRDKWLLPTRMFSPSEPSIKGVVVSGGREFNQAQLGESVEACTVFADVFKEWEPYRDRQTIVFAPLVKYCNGLAEQFNRRYGDGTAAVIEGGTNKRDRAELFERFNDRTLRVLVSVDVLKEGFDCDASCGIDLQPNNQLRTFVQKTGRVRRQRDEHSHAIWIDLAGNYWRHPHPDEDIDWGEVTDEKTTADITKEQRKEKSEKESMQCPACGIVPLRWTGGECPGCGHKLFKASRKVRMGNGKTVEVPIRTKADKERAAMQSAWNALRGIATYGRRAQGLHPMTYAQCGAMFKKDHGHHVPNDLQNVPPTGHNDWTRPVRFVTKSDMSKWKQPTVLTNPRGDEL